MEKIAIASQGHVTEGPSYFLYKWSSPSCFGLFCAKRYSPQALCLPAPPSPSRLLSFGKHGFQGTLGPALRTLRIWLKCGNKACGYLLVGAWTLQRVPPFLPLRENETWEGAASSEDPGAPQRVGPWMLRAAVGSGAGRWSQVPI